MIGSGSNDPLLAFRTVSLVQSWPMCRMAIVYSVDAQTTSSLALLCTSTGGFIGYDSASWYAGTDREKCTSPEVMFWVNWVIFFEIKSSCKI